MSALPLKTNLHVWVRTLQNRFGSEMFLIRRFEDGSFENLWVDIGQQGPHGEPVICGKRHERIPDGMPMMVADLKPFLVLDELLLRELLIAFSRAADEQGLPRPSEDHLKGKFEATQAHLADLRKMLFNPMTRFVTVGNDPQKGVSFGTDRDLEGERDPRRGSTQQDQ